MIGLQKKRPAAAGDYVVPNNSVLNLQSQKPGLHDPTPNAMEKATKCRYCENMAKNFLYLESLIRNNKDNSDKTPKCSLCNSSLKYLEYVNRNIRQVFGNFDAIVQADRALAAKPAMMPKYSVGPPPSEKVQVDSRAKGGAIVSPQKSAKSLKSTKITTSKLKSKEKSTIKSQKSAKSLKSHKSSKSLKSGKSAKSGKSQKSTLKLAKKGLSSKLTRPKSASPKSQISHGKMILKRKFRNKLAGSNKVVRSVSQYRSLASNRSKLSKGSSHKKLKKQRSTAAPPTSINWQLLKKNLPKRPTLVK